FLASSRPPLAHALAVGESPLVAIVHFPPSPAVALPATTANVKIVAVKTRAAKRIMAMSPRGFEGEGPSSSATAYSTGRPGRDSTGRPGRNKYSGPTFSTVAGCQTARKPDIVAAHATDAREESRRCTRGFGRRKSGSRYGKRGGPEQEGGHPIRGRGFRRRASVRQQRRTWRRRRSGVRGDAQERAAVRAAPGPAPDPDVRDRGGRRRDSEQGAQQRREHLHHRRARFGGLQHPAGRKVRPVRPRRRRHA